MEIEKTIAYWLEGAKSDMVTAKILFREGQYSQCLFWCHLVLEKLLKAHVVNHTKTQAPYSHNLLQLTEKSGLKFSEKQKEALAEMSEFNLMARYPDETMEFKEKCTTEFADKYFSITLNFYQWLQKIVLQ